MTDDPPLYLILTIIILALLISFFYYLYSIEPIEEVGNWTSYEGMFLYSRNIPQIEAKVLASLTAIEDNRLFKIIECESNFRNICNYDGCRYGIGVAQIIQTTADYCSKKLGKEINPYNPMDNIECANWLIENEGVRHWKQSVNCHRYYE